MSTDITGKLVKSHLKLCSILNVKEKRRSLFPSLPLILVQVMKLKKLFLTLTSFQG